MIDVFLTLQCGEFNKLVDPTVLTNIDPSTPKQEDGESKEKSTSKFVQFNSTINIQYWWCNTWTLPYLKNSLLVYPLNISDIFSGCNTPQCSGGILTTKWVKKSAL